ncbi:MAG TPA: hypothetical protein VFQ60_03540 [Patescibacteria group bacterium]|nr:hypothetical protein [Patescibacteria group bacterium]
MTTTQNPETSATTNANPNQETTTTTTTAPETTSATTPDLPRLLKVAQDALRVSIGFTARLATIPAAFQGAIDPAKAGQYVPAELEAARELLVNQTELAPAFGTIDAAKSGGQVTFASVREALESVRKAVKETGVAAGKVIAEATGGSFSELSEKSAQWLTGRVTWKEKVAERDALLAKCVALADVIGAPAPAAKAVKDFAGLGADIERLKGRLETFSRFAELLGKQIKLYEEFAALGPELGYDTEPRHACHVLFELEKDVVDLEQGLEKRRAKKDALIAERDALVAECEPLAREAGVLDGFYDPTKGLNQQIADLRGVKAALKPERNHRRDDDNEGRQGRKPGWGKGKGGKGGRGGKGGVRAQGVTPIEDGAKSEENDSAGDEVVQAEAEVKPLKVALGTLLGKK